MTKKELKQLLETADNMRALHKYAKTVYTHSYLHRMQNGLKDLEILIDNIQKDQPTMAIVKLVLTLQALNEQIEKTVSEVNKKMK